MVQRFTAVHSNSNAAPNDRPSAPNALLAGYGGLNFIRGSRLLLLYKVLDCATTLRIDNLLLSFGIEPAILMVLATEQRHR